jgi:hypothetical protein
MNALRVGLVLVLSLAAAVVANLVLLGVANGPSDPVGRLSPRAVLVPLAQVTTPAAPAPARTTTQPRSEGGDSGLHQDD